MSKDDHRNNLGSEAARLGTQPIPKLLLVFSMPAIASNVVHALYNIISRIFVGRGVDEVALGGLSLAMPIVSVILVFPILFGIGSAILISIRLGEGNVRAAQAAANHSIWLSVIAGLAVTVVGVIFIDPIISILGAQEGSQALLYCREYLRILLYGTTIQFLGLSMANIIRSQGFPTGAMLGFVISVAVNIGLLYPFIFVFRLGVEGAGWATVIAQGAMLAWFIIFYLTHKMQLRLAPFEFKISGRIALDLIIFGSSQAASQLALSFTMAFFNNRASYFGAIGLPIEHGGDIALSAMSITAAFMQIVNLVVTGLSMGAQPILGFNHGAGYLKRVHETYKVAVIVATIVGVIGFVSMFFLADYLVYLFAPDGSPVLIALAIMAMKIIAVGLPVIGFQVVSASFFAATGRPKMSLFLSLSRQALIFIPVTFLMGEAMGLTGVIAGGPVSDFAAFLLTAVVMVYTFRKQRRLDPEGRITGQS